MTRAELARLLAEVSSEPLHPLVAEEFAELLIEARTPFASLDRNDPQTIEELRRLPAKTWRGLLQAARSLAAIELGMRLRPYEIHYLNRLDPEDWREIYQAAEQDLREGLDRFVLALERAVVHPQMPRSCLFAQALVATREAPLRSWDEVEEFGRSWARRYRELADALERGQEEDLKRVCQENAAD